MPLWTIKDMDDETFQIVGTSRISSNPTVWVKMFCKELEKEEYFAILRHSPGFDTLKQAENSSRLLDLTVKYQNEKVIDVVWTISGSSLIKKH